jgi:hypothetical protein
MGELSANQKLSQRQLVANHLNWREIFSQAIRFRRGPGSANGGESPQCRKCRTPVITMASPSRSAASIASWSRTDPPG